MKYISFIFPLIWIILNPINLGLLINIIFFHVGFSIERFEHFYLDIRLLKLFYMYMYMYMYAKFALVIHQISSNLINVT